MWPARIRALTGSVWAEASAARDNDGLREHHPCCRCDHPEKKRRHLSAFFIPDLPITSWQDPQRGQQARRRELVLHRQAFARLRVQERERAQRLVLFFRRQRYRVPGSWRREGTSACCDFLNVTNERGRPRVIAYGKPLNCKRSTRICRPRAGMQGAQGMQSREVGSDHWPGFPEDDARRHASPPLIPRH